MKNKGTITYRRKKGLPLFEIMRDKTKYAFPVAVMILLIILFAFAIESPIINGNPISDSADEISIDYENGKVIETYNVSVINQTNGIIPLNDSGYFDCIYCTPSNTCPDWDNCMGYHFLQIADSKNIQDTNPYETVIISTKLFKIADEFGNILNEPILLGSKTVLLHDTLLRVTLQIVGGGDPLPCIVIFPICSESRPGSGRYTISYFDRRALCLISGNDRYGKYRFQVEYQFEDKSIIQVNINDFSYSSIYYTKISADDLFYLITLSKENIDTNWDYCLGEYEIFLNYEKNNTPISER